MSLRNCQLCYWMEKFSGRCANDATGYYMNDCYCIQNGCDKFLHFRRRPIIGAKKGIRSIRCL